MGRRASHVVTAHQMLDFGLSLLYKPERLKRTKKEETNSIRFNLKFGVKPMSAASLYEDMQETEIDAARIENPDVRTLQYFLITLYFLRKYPVMDVIESTFDFSTGFIGRKIWEHVRKLQAMKGDVVCWPDDLNADDTWVCTVDGTHCWIKEPGHPEFSQDRKKYSHKLNKAGKSYELAIALDGGLIWMNGPFDAGANDITIFRATNGLKERLEFLGKRAIGDFGYRGEASLISFPNAQDSKQVQKFKSRALKRHENFNALIKVFEVLAGRFRHSEAKFGMAFEAVCVLCQYKLENEMPLYDILIQDVIDAQDDDSTLITYLNGSDDSDSDSDEDI